MYFKMAPSFWKKFILSNSFLLSKINQFSWNLFFGLFCLLKSVWEDKNKNNNKESRQWEEVSCSRITQVLGRKKIEKYFQLSY